VEREQQVGAACNSEMAQYRVCIWLLIVLMVGLLASCEAAHDAEATVQEYGGGVSYYSKVRLGPAASTIPFKDSSNVILQLIGITAWHKARVEHAHDPTACSSNNVLVASRCGMIVN